MKYAAIAEKAAREAGELVRKYQGKEKGIHFKAERDIATIADKKSEELLRKILIEDNFPEHDFLSEESEFRDAKSEYRWIVDPVDGTGNFAHENPLWGISVGLMHKGEMVAGAVCLPTLDEMFIAEKGKGAFLNGKKIGASSQSEFYDLLLCVEMAPNEEMIRKTLLLEKSLALKHRVRTLGSAAMDLAFLACGRFDVFISAYLYIWDVAAAICIIGEAGGICSRLDGSRIDPLRMSFDFAASNGILHRQLIEKLQ
ncbi:MAG TPA: inositol monophosphatase family protein [Candidatus Norongarragalinales archaeon]|nr:inositol monophosphatase family protein [Candidatus Norongarragalinales archaeon]